MSVNDWLRANRVDFSKPPLKPRQAIIMSLIAVFGGLVAAAAAHLLLFVQLATVSISYAVGIYLAVAFSWSSLEWRTRKAAVRGHNALIIFILCVFVVLLFVQEDYDVVPKWVIMLFVAAGIAGHSVMGVCGFRNFLRWRRGEFRQE